MNPSQDHSKIPFQVNMIPSQDHEEHRDSQGVDSNETELGESSSNCSAISLTIGEYKVFSKDEVQVVAKFYFQQRRIIWEISEGSLKGKIEIPWSYISGITAYSASGILKVELNERPLHFKERAPPEPGKPTKWENSDDFTGGQATLYPIHIVKFALGTLDRHYQKLLGSDERLLKLSESICFPTGSPFYFATNTTAAPMLSPHPRNQGNDVFPRQLSRRHQNRNRTTTNTTAAPMPRECVPIGYNPNPNSTTAPIMVPWQPWNPVNVVIPIPCYLPVVYPNHNSSAAPMVPWHPGNVFVPNPIQYVPVMNPPAGRTMNNAPQYHHHGMMNNGGTWMENGHIHNAGFVNSQPRQVQNHLIDGRRNVEAKVFVGGLPSTVTKSDLKEYFDQFGTITDHVVMYDYNTKKPRGFGFVTYDSEEAAERVLVNKFHQLNGKRVEVKRPTPRE